MIDTTLWDVTKTQVQILAFIRDYLISTDHRMGPLYREIGDHVGLTAHGVMHHVKLLTRMGYIERRYYEGRCRAIRKVRLPGEPPL